jgi:Flp pilus assembly protein TadB
MLEAMVAMPTLDLVVTLTWVGALAAFLLGQAFLAWLAHRHATRSARLAAKLADATKTEAAPQRGPSRTAAAERPALRVVHSAGDAGR